MYIYDASGAPVGMQYRSFTYANGVYDVYLFEKSLQGDILAVYSAEGVKLISYEYDAWGSFTTTYHNGGENTSAVNNRFTYRGYYYDSDLGMYYLNARYYDQNIKRFLSPDTTAIISVTPMALTDKNLFAYCDNNPVMRVDHGGAFWHIIVGAAAGAFISGIVKVAENVIEDKPLTDGLATAMLAGAASGALAATGVGIIGMIAGNAAISMAENAANQVIENKGFDNFDVGDMLFDGAIGGISGALGGAGKGSKHLTNLGKQTVKRTYNDTANKGLKAGVKEAGKAFAYYIKNSSSYYLDYFKRGLPGDLFSTVVTTIAKSKYMKYQYHQILEM